jgi:hypothetical protein
VSIDAKLFNNRLFYLLFTEISVNLSTENFCEKQMKQAKMGEDKFLYHVRNSDFVIMGNSGEMG